MHHANLLVLTHAFNVLIYLYHIARYLGF